MVHFLTVRQAYGLDLFDNKKSKSSPEMAAQVLPAAIEMLAGLPEWSREVIHDGLLQLAARLGVKNGQLMWPVRIAASGQEVTPGGAVEILTVLGRHEALARLQAGLQRLNGQTDRAGQQPDNQGGAR